MNAEMNNYERVYFARNETYRLRSVVRERYESGMLND
jgi:hypothetical protein